MLWPFHNHIPLAVCENFLYLLVASRRHSASWLSCLCVNLLAYVRIIVLVQHTKTHRLETVISDVLSCFSVTCRQMPVLFTTIRSLLNVPIISLLVQDHRLNWEARQCSSVSWHFLATINQQNLDYKMHFTSVSYVAWKITVKHENMLGQRILLMLSGLCFRIVTVPRRGAGWVSSAGKAVLCGMWLVS